MPQIAPVITAVSAAVGVAGTVASFSQQKKATEAQEKQQKLQARRSQRQLIREAQIRRASAMNAAGQMGGLGGSAISGGVTSLGSQTGEALGFSNTMTNLSRQISSASNMATLFSDASKLGFAAYNFFGDQNRFPRSQDTTTAAPKGNPTYMMPSLY